MQPQQPQQKATAQLADILVPFAEAGSINPRDAANTLKKRIVLSLGFTDTRRLHALLFPRSHLDWDAVLPYVQNVSLSVSEWCELVSLIHFIREPERPKHVTEMVSSALAGLKVSVQGKSLSPIESMQVSFARAGMAPTWDILAKSLLLCNLVDVEHAAALHCFLNDSAQPPGAINNNNNNKRGNSSNIAALISHIGAHRHTSDEYTAVFAGILSNEGCHVAAHHIMRSLKVRDEAHERVRQGAGSMLRASQKPSLTDIVARHAEALMLIAADADGSSRVTASFPAFCSAARMQSNASGRIRRACYYVMSLPSQAGMDHTTTTDMRDATQECYYSAAIVHAEALRRIVGDDPVVLAALRPIGAVTAPDVAVLRLFLDEVHHTGPAPRCLRAFRDAIIAAPSGMATAWSTVLRLYLAAYSRAPRDLWTHSLVDGENTNVNNAPPLNAQLNYHSQLPPETEKMIRAYVAEHPIALIEVMSALTGDADESAAAD